MRALRVLVLVSVWAGFVWLHPAVPTSLLAGGGSVAQGIQNNPEIPAGPVRVAQAAVQTPVPEPNPPAQAPPTPQAAVPTPGSATDRNHGAVNQAGSEKAGLRIDSRFEDPRQILDWLIAQGGQVLMTDARYRPVAEAHSGGRVGAFPSTLKKSGVWRAADVEVRVFVGSNFPSDAVHGIVLWPQRIWDQIHALAAQHDALRAQMDYRIEDNRLAVRVSKLLGSKGGAIPANLNWVHIQ